jgi:hypothetical protein
MRMLVLGLAVALAPLGAAADDVFLTSGGQLSGRIVKRTAASIEVDVGGGTITVPTSHVVRVVEGRSALHDYEDRARAIAAGDVEGWLALGQWASGQGLGAQARQAYHRALSAAPNDPRANEAVGNVQMNGRWVTQDESYQARGYIRYGGDWITPAEHAAILQEQNVETQREDARRESDQRAREAEARADEAEARAREAEAKAAETTIVGGVGLPLWYGWGAGPNAWPTGPVITQPIAGTRPVTRPVRPR